MTVSRVFAICLAVGMLVVADDRCHAQSTDGDESEFIAADAALAVSTSKAERLAYEAKWLPAVKEMERQITIDADRTGIWIEMLKKINTPQSRALLRRLAMGEVKTRNLYDQSQAARSLLACDKTECWMLFSSTNPGVLNSALDAVAGQLVEEKRLEVLKTCSKHSNTSVRFAAVGVLGREAPRWLALDALECIGQALDSIGPTADIDISENRGQFPHRKPEEAAYLQVMFALKEVRVDNQTLHQLAATKTGRGRDVINLALAHRGDSSVRASMLKLAQDPKADLLRAWAVSGLSKIGTPDDVPVLRKIASTDPLTRVIMTCSIPADGDRPYYPVRVSADNAILAIELRTKK